MRRPTCSGSGGGASLPRGTSPPAASSPATDLAVKRPGFGIPVDALDQVVGRHVAQDVAGDQVLEWDDLVR